MQQVEENNCDAFIDNLNEEPEYYEENKLELFVCFYNLRLKIQETKVQNFGPIRLLWTKKELRKRNERRLKK